MCKLNIGAGDNLDSLPINFRYRTYVCQSLYRAEELDLASGTINALTLYNDFEYSMTRPTQIYLTSTLQNDLSVGFIPTSEMTLVLMGLWPIPVEIATCNSTSRRPMCIQVETW